VELEPGLIAVIVGVMVGAALLNGVAGFGFALLAVAGMAVVLEPRTAIILMSLVTPVLTTMQLRYHWVYRGVTVRLPMVLAGAAVGTVLGSQLLVILPVWALSITLGLFALWFGISSLKREPMKINPKLERRIAPGVGLLVGVTQGTIGASGPVLGSYLLAIGLRAREFIFGISLVFALMSFVRVVALAALDQYTLTRVAFGLSLVVPAFLGQQLGFRLQGRLSPVAFQRVIIAVLLLASANLLYRGITQGLEQIQPI
jgi:uncharacterized protein